MELSGHRGKPFYCRDWAFEKLRTCLNKRPTSATCGTLVMGDSGCGKTAFCSELAWPTRDNTYQRELSHRLVAHHFCSAISIQSLSLTQFLHSISDQLSNHDIIGEQYRQQLSKQSDNSDSTIKDPDKYMLTQIVSPLNDLPVEPNQVLYILVDGLDECEDSPAVNESHSQSIPQLLAKYHRRFPPWLALVCTCSTKAKRISRLFTGFRKLAIDDITRSHVIQDIQQYILHRLDADASLKRHLDKDMAEVLDKLHVKCNGCILYIELILDMVSQGTVLLRHVGEIPATLGGLYLWICQKLYDDISEYSLIAKPLFSILLATKLPLTSDVIYNALLSRNNTIKLEDFYRCINKLSPVLLTVKNDLITFCHPSFTLWLQDVKFCSQTFLCNVREGHELLALYYTAVARSLTNEQVCEYAYHIQRCNIPLTGSKRSSWQPSSNQGRDLTIHEQAVWILLSEAELQSPSVSMSVSMVNSLMLDSSCMSVSALDGEPLNSDNAESAVVATSSPDPIATGASTESAAQAKESCNDETANLPTTTATSQSSEANVLNNPDDDPCAKDNVDSTGLISPNANTGSCQHENTQLADTLDTPVADVIGVNPSADCDATQLPDVADSVEDEEPDELQCLDEDVEGVETRDDVMDSEIESIGSPVGDLPECSEPVEPSKQVHPTSSSLEEALSHSDLTYLETAINQGLDVNLPDKEDRLPLVYASSQGQLEVVEMLILMAGAEVNLPDIQQRTALEVASDTGHESIVSFLLNNEADANRKDQKGRTALLTASSNGHNAIVDQLLSYGADINSRQSDGQTSLCLACSCGSHDHISANHVEVVKILIQSNCDVNAPDNKQQTPLHHVSLKGHLELCDMLLAANAAVDPVDECQRTPLLCAVAKGHTKVAERLIAAEADVHHLDQDGRTSLGLACLYGHDKLVRTFLEMGQDEMHRDNYGVDCLHFAAMEGHTMVTRMLLNYGADVNSTDDQGRTSLLMAAINGRLDCLNVLLSHGADTNLPSLNGKTPLRAACVGGHITCARSLIRHDADPGFVDMEGRNIIYILALENSPKCIPLLVESSADVNADDEQGRTALHVACWQGHIEVVTALLNLDIMVDIEDNERRTPLQSAAWQGHAHIAELLCARGANVNHMCDQGATPLCIAAQEGFIDLSSVLCNYGADPNHCDRYGRTALKIAMKTNQQQLLHLLENIMRRYKPAALTPEAARSRMPSENTGAVYENCSTHHSDQSGNSSVELVAPYAVVSLPRDDSRNPPKLLPRASRLSNTSCLHPDTSRPNLQRHSKLPAMDQRQKLTAQHLSTSSVHNETQVQRDFAVESQLRQSAAELRQLQYAAKSNDRQSNHSQQQSSSSTRQVSSTKHSSHTQSAAKIPPSPTMDDLSETSDGCDTAPSTQSSTREDNSTDSDCSENIPPGDDSESFSQQIVQLGSRQSHNATSNVEQILSGQVGYMANPKINRALYNASQIAAGNIIAPTEHVPMVRSPNRNTQPVITGSKISRPQSKQVSKGHKMTAMQNTARTPTYKVQYAAADHPSIPANYSVRNNELMSAEHSLSSVKSRQAKIVSSSGTRSTPDSVSLTSNQSSTRYSPPPVLPPRKGRPSQPLHSSPQSSKPMLVGVVRPRAQCQGDHTRRVPQPEVPIPHRSGQKETSL